MRTPEEIWYYCRECGRTGPIGDMLIGDDCCLEAVYEEGGGR